MPTLDEAVDAFRAQVQVIIAAAESRADFAEQQARELAEAANTLRLKIAELEAELASRPTPAPEPEPAPAVGITDLRVQGDPKVLPATLLYTIKTPGKHLVKLNGQPLLRSGQQTYDSDGKITASVAGKFSVVDPNGNESNTVAVGPPDIVVGPSPAPEPAGQKIPSGQPIPFGVPVLLQRGGQYELPGWDTTAPLLIDAYGSPDAPLPLIHFTATNQRRLFDIRAGCKVRNIALTTTSEIAEAFYYDSADCVVDNVELLGSAWYFAHKLGLRCKGLRVSRFGGDSVIRGHWVYDASEGGAEDVRFDLGGKTWHGSREENVIRLKGVNGFYVGNGTVLAPRGLSMQKSWLTVQSAPGKRGSSNVTAEDLTVKGPSGIGSIETQSGWQDQQVENVTFRRLRSSDAHDITIFDGAYNVTLEDIGADAEPWVSTREPIKFYERRNPAFIGKPKPTLTVRRWRSVGPRELINHREHGVVTLEYVRHNGVVVE